MNLYRLCNRYAIESEILDTTVHPHQPGIYPAFPVEVKFRLSRTLGLDSDERVEMTGSVILSEVAHGRPSTTLIMRSIIDLVDDDVFDEINDDDSNLIEPRFRQTGLDFLSWFDDIDPRNIDGMDLTLREAMKLGEARNVQGRAMVRLNSVYDFDVEIKNDREYLLIPNTNHGLNCSLIDEANFAWFRQNIPEVVVISHGPFLDYLGVDLDEELDPTQIKHIGQLIESLFEYPIVDEGFYSEFEEIERQRQWDLYNRSDFVKDLIAAHDARFPDATSLDDLDSCEQEILADWVMADAIANYVVEFECDGESFAYRNTQAAAAEWAKNLTEPIVSQEGE